VKKRFDVIGSNDRDNRRTIVSCCFVPRAWRHLSVILFDETIRQKAKTGRARKVIEAAGTLPASRSTKREAAAILSAR